MIRRGITLVETLAVIVLLAAIAPILGHLLTTASASHVDATTARVRTTDASYAIRSAAARLRESLSTPGVTIPKAGVDSIALSDGTILRLSGSDLIVVTGALPAGTLMEGVDSFEIVYANDAGVEFIPAADASDESTISRITLRITVDGLEHSESLYREGTREYTPSSSHEGAWFEDFEDVGNGATYDDGGTAWSTLLDGHSVAIHGVQSNRYHMSRMLPRGHAVTWISEEIDVSGFDEFQIRAVLDGNGSLNDSGSLADYLEIGLTVDGTRQQLYRGYGFEPVGVNFRSNSYTGAIAQIDVRAHVTGGDEHYYFDDISLEAPTASSGTFAFGSSPIIAYDPGRQDGQRRLPTSYELLDGGNVLRIEGNAWKAIRIDYEVTEDTVIEFDFRTDDIGEINGLMFDTDLRLNGGSDTRSMVVVAGTQRISSIRSPAIDAYDLSGDWQTFTVPFGQLAQSRLIGQQTYLVFISDEDRRGESVSEYRNIRIYDE